MSGRTVIALLAGAGIVLVVIALFNLFTAPHSRRVRLAEISYSALLAEVEAKNVRSATFEGNTVHAQYNDGRQFTSYLPPAEKPVERMLANGVTVSARAAPPEDGASAISIIAAWFPFFLYIGAMWLFMARPLWHIERRLQTLETALANRPGATQQCEQ
jgi:cell division protease FtsH